MFAEHKMLCHMQSVKGFYYTSLFLHNTTCKTSIEATINKDEQAENLIFSTQYNKIKNYRMQY